MEVRHVTTIKEAKKVAEDHDVGAFFLDIQLTDGSGIDFALDLRSITAYHFTPIVFITGVKTKELEAFRNTHCYDYIMKPFSYDKIEAIVKSLYLNRAIREEKKDERHVVLEFKGIRQKVNLDDIAYIENRQRKLYIVTLNEEIKYKTMSLTKFSESLDDRFIQVHQSCLVNKSFVERVDLSTSSIILQGFEEEIPIGKSYKRMIKENDELL